MASRSFDFGKGLPSSSITLSPLACKYAMISVIGLRLIEENGKLLQSFISVGVEVVDEDEGAFFVGTGVTGLLLVGAAVVAKNAFSTTNGSVSTMATGGGLSGGCGCIGVAF
jgi:hypothetical protein